MQSYSTIESRQCTAAPALSVATTDLDRFLDAIGDERDSVAIVGAGEYREMWRYSPASGTIRREIKRNGVYHLSGPEQPLESIFKAYNGIFFRPNHVGHTNYTWRGSQVLFCEWDDLAIEEQWEQVQRLRDMGLAPTAIIHSGSKSLHVYVSLDRTVTDPEEWLRLTRKLAIAMGSDPAICTLNREMRLPGGLRLKDGEWREQTLLETHPENRYSPEAIEAVLDAGGMFPLGLDGPRFTAWKRAKTQREKLLDKLGTATLTPGTFIDYPREFTCEEVLNADEWKAPIAPQPYYIDTPLEHNADRDRALILENAYLLPSEWGTPGTGTYEQVRNFAWAAAAVLGDYEAEALLSPLWPQRKIGQLIRSRNGKTAGGIAHVTQALKDLGFDVKRWYRHWFESHPEQRADRPQRVTEGTTPEAQKAADIASFQAYQARAKRGWEDRRQFTADTTISAPFLPQIPPGDIAIKSAMGTGKTHQLSAVCAGWDGGIVMVGSRNSLLNQTIERINQDAPHNGKRLIHAHQEGRDAYELRDPNGRVALCWDSLHRFESPSWFDGKLVILDESVGSIKHLLTGGTLAGRRQSALDGASEMIKRAGRVILLDGNQNDTVAGYIEELRGKPLHRLTNDFQPQPLSVTVHTPENPRNHSAVLGAYIEAANQGHLTAFVSDSQRLCEAMDVVLGEMGRKPFRVDSKTLSDPDFKKLVADPNLGDWLVGEGFTDVILSPSAESGLNVATNGYFSKGFGVFYGILDTDSQTQILRRVREVTDWTVHCPEYSIAKRTDGPRSCIEATLGRSTLEAITLEMANAAVLGEDLSTYTQILGDSVHYKYQIKLQASRNYEYSHTRQCLAEVLESQGHTVTLEDLGEDDDTKEAIKAIRKALIRKDSEAIFHAEPIAIDKARAIKGSFSASLEDRWKAERAILLDKLPGIEGTDLWSVELVEDCIFKNRSLIKQLQNWWLISHLDIAVNRTHKRIAAVLDGKVYLGDLLPSTAKLQYLASLGVHRFVGLATPTTPDDVKAAYQSAKRSKKARALGVAPAPQEKPLKWLGRILRDTFGVRSESTRPRCGGGNRERHYFYRESPYMELSQFIAENLQNAFGDSCLADRPQTQSGQGLDPVHTPTNTDHMSHGGMDRVKPSQVKALNPIGLTTPEQSQTVTPTDTKTLTPIELWGEWWWEYQGLILPIDANPDTTPLEDWLTLPKTA